MSSEPKTVSIRVTTAAYEILRRSAERNGRKLIQEFDAVVGILPKSPNSRRAGKAGR